MLAAFYTDTACNAANTRMIRDVPSHRWEVVALCDIVRGEELRLAPPRTRAYSVEQG